MMHYTHLTKIKGTSHTPTIIYANIKIEGEKKKKKMTRRKTKVNIS